MEYCPRFEITLQKPLIMAKMHKTLAHETRNEIVMTLIYRGKIEAIKLYKFHMGCRLYDAKVAVEKLAGEIQPGPA